MKKSTREIFTNLQASRNAKGKVRPDEKSLLLTSPASKFVGALSDIPYVMTRKGGKETLSNFANALKMPVEILIDQFNRAGISSLTPDHIIDRSHKDSLLNYLRAEHGAGPKNTVVPLYQSQIITPVQIELVQEVNEELLSLLSRDPELIYQLAPRKFEEMIARLFEDRGYGVTLTPRTRDGGYDLLAELKNDFSSLFILAECKRYKPENKVGVEVVRGLYGATEARRANQGLIITSSSFTKDAQEEKRLIGARIGLRDYSDLVKWLEPYSAITNR
jgi:hypothetical protein